MSNVPRRQRLGLSRTSTTRVYRALAHAVTGLFSVATTAEWSGQEHVPRNGGVLVVSNHISNADPLELGEFLISGCNRWPQFIGKSDIWKVPGLGWLARACGQIPVERNTDRAGNVVTVAVDAIEAGNTVCIYPEGTITADPDGWPMQPRTGAARIALTSGCPVIPIAQWGANQILPGKKLTYPRFFPRAHFSVRAGAPVPLDDLRALPLSHEVLVEAAERMTDAITDLLAEIRGVPAPSQRYDIRTDRWIERESRLEAAT